MAEEVLEKIEIQEQQMPKTEDVESGKIEDETKTEKVLDATSSAYMKYFLKVFGVLTLNFFLSMLAIYIMVTARLFFETRSINVWIVIIAVVAAVISYTFLYYTLELTKKIVLVPLLVALYLYIASMSVVMAYLASELVFATAIIMYSLVAVTIGLVALLLYTIGAKFCLKQGSKRWAFIAMCIGVLISLAYISIVIFVGKRPIALPRPVLNVLLENGKYQSTDNSGVVQEIFPVWRKLVLFIISSVLSGGFIAFLVSYSLNFLLKAENPKEASSMRTIFNIYIYLTLPAVAIIRGFTWIVKKTASAAKKTAEKANVDDDKNEGAVSKD